MSPLVEPLPPYLQQTTGTAGPAPVGSGASVRAELLQVVASPGGSVLLDLADGVNYSYVPDTLTIDPSGQQGGSSTGLTLDQGGGYVTISDERYGGSNVDYDRRPNGVLSWRAIIMQTSTQAIAQTVQALLAEVERADPPGSRYLAWQRYTATAPLYYERRGPGAWTVVERWETGEIAQIDISLPVAPVAYGPPTTTALAAKTLPATWALPAPGGTLPALMDVTTQTAAALEWAAIGAYQGPLGLYGATSGGASGGWVSTSDAGAMSGTKLSAAVPSASTYYQVWFNIDASTAALNSGEYESDMAVEVWIRARWNPSLMTPLTGIAFAQPSDATLRVYTLEFGASGKTLANIGPPPLPPQATGGSVSTGGSLAGGSTYFPVLTYVNARGESRNGPQGTISIPAGTSTNRLTITSPPAAGSGRWAATGYNTYVWNGSTWILQNTGGPTAIGTTAFFSTIATTGTAIPGVDTTAPWQLFRLGTLRVPPQKNWQIVVDLLTPSTIPFGSLLGLDYVLLTPARWRASSPTGMGADSSYPSFTPVASTWIKQISNRLSATGGATSTGQHLDTGLGGAPLRCPNSTSPQLVVHASPSVPDDPTANSAEDPITVSLTPSVTLTPRYRLLDAS